MITNALIVLSALAAVAGVVLLPGELLPLGLVGLGGVLGILARIGQAYNQHKALLMLLGHRPDA